MAKTDKDPHKKLSALKAKALQRGEKLERTLTKLVAQSEPGSAAEDFLKAIQGGLKAIRKDLKAAERSLSAETRKAPKKKAEKSDKKPASTDISPLVEVNGRG